ncbi:MAG: TspO/MBR family protein [Nitratireductor sp.]
MTDKLKPILGFIFITFAVGFAAAYYSIPDAWYQNLNKAPFNPPSYVFGPAWTFLYVLIGIAGGYVYSSSKSDVAAKLAMKLWWAQLVLNGAWSLLFFTAKLPLLALIDISILIIVIAMFIKTTSKNMRPAMWCFVPYLAWVGFATLLNASIVWLN